MQIIHSAAELQRLTEAARLASQEIVFVPTMGALHLGHLSLVEAAKTSGAKIKPFVVVSIFVNPLQFGLGEDFDRYPRTLVADAKLLEAANVDVLFAPSVEEVYPTDKNGLSLVEPKHAGPIGDILEGAARPGHFDGMLTVVARLFTLVNPDRAIFGAKDAQQLFLVKKLAEREFLNLQIEKAPTVREPSGLAMSSRNRYLSSSGKVVAADLNRTLRTAVAELEAGVSPSEVIKAHREQIAKDQPTAKLEYLQLVSATDFHSVTDDFHGEAILLIAAIVEGTRLIDNLEVFI